MKIRRSAVTGSKYRGSGKLPVRERIGRYKYTLEENLDEEYKSVWDALEQEIAQAKGKGGL